MGGGSAARGCTPAAPAAAQARAPPARRRGPARRWAALPHEHGARRPRRGLLHERRRRLRSKNRSAPCPARSVRRSRGTAWCTLRTRWSQGAHVLAQAVVLLQDAEREVLQQRRLVRHDAPVRAHLPQPPRPFRPLRHAHPCRLCPAGALKCALGRQLKKRLSARSILRQPGQSMALSAAFADRGNGRECTAGSARAPW